MKTSVYIHIPFCASICGYCDFYSVAKRKDDFMKDYVSALAEEFDYDVRSGMLDPANVYTIYIGGGTPTVLPVYLWDKLHRVLLSKIDLSSVEEFSVECNPESFTNDHAKFFEKIGVTRLTFGVQSLNDDELKICNRPHNAKTALDVLNNTELLKPFDSIGVDIIYGLPNQTVESLDNTLQKIMAIPRVKHLSAYELTIADDSPFGEIYNDRYNKSVKWADHELLTDMFYQINSVCYANGWGQYEVSNYAREEKYQSLHNKAYWERKPYIGIGAGAHSQIGVKRFAIARDVDAYVKGLVKEGRLPLEIDEELSQQEIARELIMLGLRYVVGIDEDEYLAKTGMEFATKKRVKKLKEFMKKELIKREEKKWIPTSLGMLFADHIACEIIDDLVD